MIPRPRDPRPRRARALAQMPVRAPIWGGRPGFTLYAVTGDATEAVRRARATAVAHRCQLAPGTWPVDLPTDTRAIAVGPVYVGVRTRRVEALARDVATYYVLRRWMADEVTQAPDPAWPLPAITGPTATPSAAPPVAPAKLPAASPPAAEAGPAWPFTAVGRRLSRAGSKTLGADVITWRGPLLGQTITFTTQPRAIDAHASFLVPSNAWIQYRSEHPQFIDVCVHHPLSDEGRGALIALAQAQEARPVVVRCVGEPLRARHVAARPARRDMPPCDAAAPRLFPAPTNRRCRPSDDAPHRMSGDVEASDTGDA